MVAKIIHIYLVFPHGWKLLKHMCICACAQAAFIINTRENKKKQHKRHNSNKWMRVHRDKTFGKSGSYNTQCIWYVVVVICSNLFVFCAHFLYRTKESWCAPFRKITTPPPINRMRLHEYNSMLLFGAPHVAINFACFPLRANKKKRYYTRINKICVFCILFIFIYFGRKGNGWGPKSYTGSNR